MAALIPAAHPQPILDPELELFERDDGLLTCLSCLREHREDARRCRLCASPLVRMSRARWRLALECEPVADLRRQLQEGLPRLPASLECLGEFMDPFAAEAAQRELLNFGVQAFIGHDAIDPAGPPFITRLWSRPGDAATARYLTGPLERGDPASPAADDEGRARSFLRHGKWRDALALATREPRREALAPIAAEALLKLGRPAEAARALAADIPGAGAAVQAERYFQRALHHALSGAAALALADLHAAAALAPYRLAIAQARVELLRERGSSEDLRAALAVMKAISPAALGGGGPFAALERKLTGGEAR